MPLRTTGVGVAVAGHPLISYCSHKSGVEPLYLEPAVSRFVSDFQYCSLFNLFFANRV